MSFGHFIRCGLFLTDKTTQSLTGQALLMFQVAIRNQFAFGMIAKPAFAVPQKFFDFRVADPVVLVVIQDRNKT